MSHGDIININLAFAPASYQPSKVRAGPALIDPIQSQRVATAMSSAEKTLYEWQKGPPNHDVLDRLINVLTIELDELTRKQNDELMLRETAVETKPISVSPPIPQ